MDNKTLREKAKKRLQTITYMKRRSQALVDRQKVLHDRAEGLRGIAYDGDRVQTSPTNAMEEALLALYDLEDQYAHTLADLAEEIQCRECEIDGLPDLAQKEVLKAMYIDDHDGRRTLWAVAKDLHRSYDAVRHLHTAGLIAYGKLYIDTK